MSYVDPRETGFRGLTHLSLLSNPTSATGIALRVADVDSEALKDVSRVGAPSLTIMLPALIAEPDGS
jgi:hypothetical protein